LVPAFRAKNTSTTVWSGRSAELKEDRSLPFDTPPLRRTWNGTSECFPMDTEALEIDIPWFNVLRWRPRGGPEWADYLLSEDC